MRIPVFVFVAAIAFCGAAIAHPGANLLTTDSKAAPRAMSGKISFEESNGVHLFKGSPLAQHEDLLGGEPVGGAERIIEIEIRDYPWRRFRHLRTQGFYSGIPYPSRRYTQGFYSGRP